jgi:DNA-binding GntR family transcriptional regulator
VSPLHVDDWIAALAAESVPAPVSTAERVVDILRTRLSEGLIAPGSRMSEDALAKALGVSRNTLREAFRLLVRERLLVHELNRGVFVRCLTVNDVHSLYRLRCILEVAALRQSTPDSRAVARLRNAVDEGRAAAARQDWKGLGTANQHFHRAVVGLFADPRIDELMSQLLAELRLAFHVMHPLKDFHLPYLKDNERVCSLVEAGDADGAADVLLTYLGRAERQLVHAYEVLQGQTGVGQEGQTAV